MKCIYSGTNLDSLCSAAIVSKAFKGCGLVAKSSKKFPIEMVDPGEVIYIVGCSLPLEDMQAIASVGIVHWYNCGQDDISLVTKLKLNDKSIIGIDSKVGSCERLWGKLFPKDPCPKSVLAISADTQHKADTTPMFAEFCRGIVIYPCEPKDTDFWLALFDDDDPSFADMASLGELLLRVKSHADAIICGMAGFYSEIEGHKCVVINYVGATKKTFESIYDPEHHDFMVAFGFVQGQWRVVIYSDKEEFDALQLASKLGDVLPLSNRHLASSSADELLIPLPVIKTEATDVSK